jgi:DNA mismatch repair ATPase MutS
MKRTISMDYSDYIQERITIKKPFKDRISELEKVIKEQDETIASLRGKLLDAYSVRKEPVKPKEKEAWLIEVKRSGGLCLAKDGKCFTTVSDYEGALKFSSQAEAEAHLFTLEDALKFFVSDHIWITPVNS